MLRSLLSICPARTSPFLKTWSTLKICEFTLNCFTLPIAYSKQCPYYHEKNLFCCGSVWQHKWTCRLSGPFIARVWGRFGIPHWTCGWCIWTFQRCCIWVCILLLFICSLKLIHYFLCSFIVWSAMLCSLDSFDNLLMSQQFQALTSMQKNIGIMSYGVARITQLFLQCWGLYRAAALLSRPPLVSIHAGQSP